jgi:aminoglycoside phosphotransferase (APT) family kinase protein
MLDEMRNRLQAYYANAFPMRINPQIGELTSISAGWESDVYSFVAEHGPANERQSDELILRVYPGDDAYEKSAREFHGMGHLHNAGYPVPEVMRLERDDSPFDRPFIIMEKIDGRPLWPIINQSPDGEKQALLTTFCELMVELHKLDWRPHVSDVSRFDTGDPYIFVNRYLDFFRPFFERFPMPGFTPVMAWMDERRHLVPCERPAPIHQDFHPNNVLLRDDGKASVIDWTQIEISDPRFDVAWTLILFTKPGRIDQRDHVLSEYERISGSAIERLDFFEVVACFKRLGSVAISLIYGPEKLGMRPEAVNAMKLDMPAHRMVYEHLLERTGIAIPEVEAMLEEG